MCLTSIPVILFGQMRLYFLHSVCTSCLVAIFPLIYADVWIRRPLTWGSRCHRRPPQDYLYASTGYTDVRFFLAQANVSWISEYSEKKVSDEYQFQHIFEHTVCTVCTCMEESPTHLNILLNLTVNIPFQISLVSNIDLPQERFLF